MIVWLEDRRDTVVALLPMFARKNLEYQMLGKPATFVNFLDEMSDKIIGEGRQPVFLIDIMMHGVSDLSEIGLLNAPTMSGNHAGYVFVDRYLRSADSKWSNVPVCFLTEREIDEQLVEDVKHLNDRGPAPAKVFSKYHESKAEEMLALIESWQNV